MTQKDLLIIDDESVINDAVQKITSFEGYTVEAALSAADALKMLEKCKYRLILCDIMMPGMDGLQFLDEIQHKKINIPVIIITGFSTVENAVKSLYKGALDFIPKPFTFDELMSSISRGFEIIRLQKEAALGEVDSIAFVPCPPKYMKLGNTSWMKLEKEGLAVIGAADIFVKSLLSIKTIELLNSDEVIVQGNSCAQFESSNGLVHNFLAPIGGKILKRNYELLKNPGLIEKDPYFEGWLYKVIPSDIGYETKSLIPCSSERL